jgi:hypothetical protein
MAKLVPRLSMGTDKLEMRGEPRFYPAVDNFSTSKQPLHGSAV